MIAHDVGIVAAVIFCNFDKNEKQPRKRNENNT